MNGSSCLAIIFIISSYFNKHLVNIEYRTMLPQLRPEYQLILLNELVH